MVYSLFFHNPSHSLIRLWHVRVESYTLSNSNIPNSSMNLFQVLCYHQMNSSILASSACSNSLAQFWFEGPLDSPFLGCILTSGFSSLLHISSSDNGVRYVGFFTITLRFLKVSVLPLSLCGGLVLVSGAELVPQLIV